MTARLPCRLTDNGIREKEEMATQPEVVQRAEQPYVAIRTLVTMRTIGEVLPELHPEVRSWLRSQGVQPAGQPFFKFNVIDMDRQLEVEVGFPVAAAMTGDDRVLAAVLSAGRYATLRHTGHPDELIDATRRLALPDGGAGLRS
jgi:effector-binding domain-containing protein